LSFGRQAGRFLQGKGHFWFCGFSAGQSLKNPNSLFLRFVWSGLVCNKGNSVLYCPKLKFLKIFYRLILTFLAAFLALVCGKSAPN